MGLDTSWTEAHPLPGMSQKQAQTRTRTRTTQTQKRDWSEWGQFQKESESLIERFKFLHSRWLNRQLSESERKELMDLESALFERAMQTKQFK